MLVTGLVAAYSASTSSAPAGTQASPQVNEVEVRPRFVTDFSDGRRLVGWADDVFLAEVVGVEDDSATTTGDDRAKTVYRVRVLETIKGSLDGEARVWQLGGREADGTVTHYVGAPMMRVGSRYFVVSKGTGEERLVVFGFGAIPADTDEQRTKARRLLERADAEQIPYSPDAEGETTPDGPEGE